MITLIAFIILKMLNIFSWILFIRIIFEILLRNQVINASPFVSSLFNMFFILTEPVLNFVRERIPTRYSMIDMSYLITFLGIMVLRILIATIFL